jgi:hypothetical protein
VTEPSRRKYIEHGKSISISTAQLSCDNDLRQAYEIESFGNQDIKATNVRPQNRLLSKSVRLVQ